MTELSPEDRDLALLMVGSNETATALAYIVIDEQYLGDTISAEQFVDVVRRIRDTNPEDNSVMATIARNAATLTFLELALPAEG